MGKRQVSKRRRKMRVVDEPSREDVWLREMAAAAQSIDDTRYGTPGQKASTWRRR